MFLNATKRRMTGGSPSHPNASLAFLNREFSNIVLERSEQDYAWRYMPHEGNRFALLVTKKI